MKKHFLTDLKEKVRKPFDALSTKLSPWAEFLGEGRPGGIIAMLLLSFQFDIMKAMFGLPFPKPLTMLLSAVLTIILAESGQISSNTSKPFSRSVEPVSTISTITSDNSTRGPSSTEPFSLIISTV